MLKIEVKFLPFGNPNKVEILKTMNIINDGTGTQEKGNYTFELTVNSRVKKGYIKKYLRKKDVWFLVFCCLKEIFEGGKK